MQCVLMLHPYIKNFLFYCTTVTSQTDPLWATPDVSPIIMCYHARFQMFSILTHETSLLTASHLVASYEGESVE